jgi:hypothetical protein
MAAAAPVRPWQPAFCPVIENGELHTRFSLVVAYSTRRHEAAFNVRVRLYSKEGRENGNAPLPAHEAHYEAVPFASGLRVEMADVVGRGAPFDGIAEILVEDPDSRPPLPSRSNILHSWVYLYHEDGSQFVLSPCYQQKGGFKRLWTSQFQIWPGVIVNDECDSAVMLINPYDKSVTARVLVYNPVGDRLCCQSDLQIPPKAYYHGCLADEIPGLTEFLAPWKGIGTLLLDSRYKLNNYVWLRHTASGTATCMDHLAQFVMRGLESVDVEGRDGSGMGASRRVDADIYV